MLPLLFELTTTAWQAGERIPSPYTCSGADRSPALAWTAPPEGTASFALVFDDPDAPGKTWVHWLVWNLPPTARGLPEGLAATAPGAVQGTTDFGTFGYGGPCPPEGHGLHRYFVRLYALDTTLGLAPAATRAELDAAMKGHVLASTQLMGTFSR